MSSLLFVSGQIAALEDKLLKQGQLDRMIGADTSDEAFGVMSELAYAQYFDDSLQARDFAQVIERGLQETKTLLENGSNHHPVLEIIWARFDVNNIKRALKERFLEARTEIGEFTEDNGYSPLGSMDQDTIEALVWNGRGEEGVIPSAVLAVTAGDFDIKSTEIALDKAYFQHISSKIRGGVVGEYVKLLIDAYNFRSVTRSVLVLQEPLEASLWAEGGNLEYDRFKSIETAEALQTSFEATPFSEQLSSVGDSISGEVLLIEAEKAADQYVYQWLKEASLGSDSILRVLYYFEQRLQNARMLKTVMLGKFYGLDVVAIQEKLKHVGH